MWKRTRLINVADDLPAAGLLLRLGSYDLVVIDVDNTLAPDEAPGREMAIRLDEARAAARRAGIGRLVVISNGPRTRAVPGDGVLWEVSKPFTRASRLGVAPGQSVAVVGDKVLTDGFLAHRLGADFYVKPFSPPEDRPGRGIRRAMARAVRRLLFTIERLG
jgi:predicted HAD superfamily phosphohydrolase YqeG